MNTVYYAVSCGDITASLPKNLIEHAVTKQSLNAWSLLSIVYQKAYGEVLDGVTFDAKGKPLKTGGYISISHSKGAVAVCFSKTVNCGVDIELITPKIPAKTAKLLGVNNVAPTTFYTAWTERESVIKALSKPALAKDLNGLFKGVSKVIELNEKKYSLSLYGEDCKFELIKLD